VGTYTFYLLDASADAASLEKDAVVVEELLLFYHHHHQVVAAAAVGLVAS
jgi:hypothetical protein